MIFESKYRLFIHENAFKNVVCEMATIFCRGRCFYIIEAICKQFCRITLWTALFKNKNNLAEEYYFSWFYQRIVVLNNRESSVILKAGKIIFNALIFCIIMPFDIVSGTKPINVTGCKFPIPIGMVRCLSEWAFICFTFPTPQHWTPAPYWDKPSTQEGDRRIFYLICHKRYAVR